MSLARRHGATNLEWWRRPVHRQGSWGAGGRAAAAGFRLAVGGSAGVLRLQAAGALVEGVELRMAWLAHGWLSARGGSHAHMDPPRTHTISHQGEASAARPLVRLPLPTIAILLRAGAPQTARQWRGEPATWGKDPPGRNHLRRFWAATSHLLPSPRNLCADMFLLAIPAPPRHKCEKHLVPSDQTRAWDKTIASTLQNPLQRRSPRTTSKYPTTG